MQSFRCLTVAAVLFAATGPVLAKQAPAQHQQVATVTSNDHSLHHVVGHLSTMGADQSAAASDPEYLNLHTHNAPHTSNVSLEGGEPTPYGFPGASYPDDQIGFYKDNYVNYENSPLDGYYSWSGHISP
jgi:hypothetical protein